MAHMMKHTKAACGHMCSHYDRSAKNIGNENIKPERTKENYNLAVERDMSQIDFIKQRCSEVKCLNRQDVNVMCSWVVTAPKGLPSSDHEEFFHETYNFLNKRYSSGTEENIISAHVHMDEIQPHMHFAFVPVFYDEKKDIKKISVKNIVTRKDLQTFHKDLDIHMTKVFGREIGILNEATREGNKSIQELKRESAIERLHNAKEQATKIVTEAKKIVLENLSKSEEARQEGSKFLIQAKEESRSIKDSLVPLQIEYEAKKSFIDQSTKDSHISKKYPDYARINKSLFGKETITVPKEMWEARYISANQVEALQKEREALEEGIKKLQQTVSAEKIKSLETEVDALKRTNIELQKRIQKMCVDIDRVNKVFEKSPEIKKAFSDTEKLMKSKNLSFER